MWAMKKYVMSAIKQKQSGFWGQELDPKQLAAQHQFLEQMQIAVALANREVIHRKIPNLTPDTFQQLAVMVARFRANYLEAAVRLSTSETHDERTLVELKQARELFDEGRAAFEALERAIERGYVDFTGRPA
jgi:hypothetical protein